MKEEKPQKKICSILVSEVGRIYERTQVKRLNKKDGETTWIDVIEPIETFTVNGEMAPVVWFRQGCKEWNGKYVIEVEHYLV